MLKEYRTRDIFGVSIGGIDAASRREYGLEGSVLAYILKKWNEDQEDWSLYLWDWEVLHDGFTLTWEGSLPELIGQEELTEDMRDKVECLLTQLLA